MVSVSNNFVISRLSRAKCVLDLSLDCDLSFCLFNWMFTLLEHYFKYFWLRFIVIVTFYNQKKFMVMFCGIFCTILLMDSLFDLISLRFMWSFFFFKICSAYCSKWNTLVYIWGKIIVFLKVFETSFCDIIYYGPCGLDKICDNPLLTLSCSQQPLRPITSLRGQPALCVSRGSSLRSC